MIIFLTITASLSPLLTFAHLFQLKEWRWDRLREHLRETGWLQLTGTVRPVALLVLILLFQIPSLRPAFAILNFSISQFLNFQFVALGVFTLLNLIQILIKRQPYPVWTKKAVTLISTSLFLTAIVSYWLLVIGYWFPIVFIPLLQFLVLTISLALLSPLDHFLKQHILARARILRSRFPDITVIGITGSAGKTTTKELLTHILGSAAIATPEHVNTEIGVARWLIKNLTPNTYNLKPVFVVEMGAYRAGEIRTLCSIAKPTIGIITTIGTQHIGLFGSQRAIAETKGELFAALPKNGHAFTIENEHLTYLQTLCKCPMTVINPLPPRGRSTPLPYPLPRGEGIENTKEDANGIAFSFLEQDWHMPLNGAHNATNAALAIAVARSIGISDETIAERLRTFQPSAHTFSIREERGITLLDDTHNASPESFRAAIAWAKNQPHPNKVLLSPGIIEQGGNIQTIHRELGSLAKDVFADAFILNKKFAQYFEQGFGKPVTYHLKAESYNLKAGALLACVGRVPQNTIQQLLSRPLPVSPPPAGEGGKGDQILQ